MSDLAFVSYGGCGYTALTQMNRNLDSDRYRHALPDQVPLETPVLFWFGDPRWAALSHARRKHQGGLPWSNRKGFTFDMMLDAGEDWFDLSEYWFHWRAADHRVEFVRSDAENLMVFGKHVQTPGVGFERQSKTDPMVWSRLTHIYKDLLVDQAGFTQPDAV